MLDRLRGGVDRGLRIGDEVLHLGAAVLDGCLHPAHLRRCHHFAFYENAVARDGHGHSLGHDLTDVAGHFSEVRRNDAHRVSDGPLAVLRVEDDGEVDDLGGQTEWCKLDYSGVNVCKMKDVDGDGDDDGLDCFGFCLRL